MYSSVLPFRVSVLQGPLVLVQERDGVDERQELQVIAPRPRHAVREREIAYMLVHHGERL